MSHKSQSSQFMHPNLCQKGISGVLHYPSLETLKRNDTEGELTLESVGKFVRISLPLVEHLEIHVGVTDRSFPFQMLERHRNSPLQSVHLKGPVVFDRITS